MTDKQGGVGGCDAPNRVNDLERQPLHGDCGNAVGAYRLATLNMGRGRLRRLAGGE